MRALLLDEIGEFFQSPPLRFRCNKEGYLMCAQHEGDGISIAIPSEASKVAVLANNLLELEAENGYYGALIWLTNWDVGTPAIEQCGLKMLEQMRRGYGLVASIENAPGHLFRSDELVDTLAFLMLPMLFGWDAFYVPHGSNYFVYIRQNGFLFVVTEEPQVYQRVLVALHGYDPKQEVPTYLKRSQ